MGQYQIVASISAFLLFSGFVVGIGADEYVEFDDQDPNLTEQDLQLALDDLEDTRYTFFSSADRNVQVNETEWNNRGILEPDIPYAQYRGDVAGIESIKVTVNIPNNTGDGEMAIAQGGTVRPLPNGTHTFENLREDDAQFRIRWEPLDTNNDRIINATLEDVTYSQTEVSRSGFLTNIQDVISVSTGYPFFNDVVLGIITLVVGLIVIKAVVPG